MVDQVFMVHEHSHWLANIFDLNLSSIFSVGSLNWLVKKASSAEHYLHFPQLLLYL